MKSLPVASLFVLVACSSAPPKDPPDFITDNAPRTRAPHGEEAVLEGAPITPAPEESNETTPQVLRGTSSTTNAFGFGGEAFDCSWQITMKDLVLDIEADATLGRVTSATLRAQAVEQTMPPCTATPIPPHEHVYEMTGAKDLSPHVTAVTLAPKSTNRPAASAVMEVDLSKKPATATIQIHRTDQRPPLDWTVVAKVSLESK